MQASLQPDIFSLQQEIPPLCRAPTIGHPHQLEPLHHQPIGFQEQSELDFASGQEGAEVAQ